MDEMLSQEEINALLSGLDSDDDSPSSAGAEVTPEEKDAIGEVANISMGTAATTLFSLVNQKVMITTPTVSITSWDKIVEEYGAPCVAIQIVYKEGLDGTNLLILQENDVKVIADLMMGGDGSSPDPELNDLHLSAIGEAMNQMIGSAATSMSSMFSKKIDIQPPLSSHINLGEPFDPAEISEFLTTDFIKVSFRLQIGELVDSEMMQLYPVEFAKDISNEFLSSQEDEVEAPKAPEAPANQGMPQMDMNQMGAMPQQQMDMNQMGMQPQMGMPQQQMGMPQQQMGMQSQMGMPQQQMGMQPQMGMPQQMGMNQMGMSQQMGMNNVEVQQAQFQNFQMNSIAQQKENIDLIMDVQLEVTVELGRTRRPIKDILEFAPGTIIELNKLSGEPIDVLVNGKIVAKGEVVVIDETFSIRVTEIVKQSGQLI